MFYLYFSYFHCPWACTASQFRRRLCRPVYCTKQTTDIVHRIKRCLIMWTYKDLIQTLVHVNLNIDRDFVHVGEPLHKQVVGGRPPRYAPAQACNRSGQWQPWARPAKPGPISQYAPSSHTRRPSTGCTWQSDVRQTVDRQTDRRQTASSLNAPWAGHNNLCLIWSCSHFAFI